MGMLTNGENKSKISYALLTVVCKLYEADRKIQNYGTDRQLHEAEIHMIMYVRDNPQLHVSGLAKKIGVTKGAVSQLVGRLERKGMLVKIKDPENNSRTMLRLSEMGVVAYDSHKKMHEDFDRVVEGLLAGAGREKVEFLQEFLADIENYIDKMK